MKRFNQILIIFLLLITGVSIIPCVSQNKKKPVLDCDNYYKEGDFKNRFSLPLFKKLKTKEFYIFVLTEGDKQRNIKIIKTKNAENLFEYAVEKDLISKTPGESFIIVARFHNGFTEVQKFERLCD